MPLATAGRLLAQLLRAATPTQSQSRTRRRLLNLLQCSLLLKATLHMIPHWRKGPICRKHCAMEPSRRVLPSQRRHGAAGHDTASLANWPKPPNDHDAGWAHCTRLQISPSSLPLSPVEPILILALQYVFITDISTLLIFTIFIICNFLSRPDLFAGRFVRLSIDHSLSLSPFLSRNVKPNKFKLAKVGQYNNSLIYYALPGCMMQREKNISTYS